MHILTHTREQGAMLVRTHARTYANRHHHRVDNDDDDDGAYLNDTSKCRLGHDVAEGFRVICESCMPVTCNAGQLRCSSCRRSMREREGGRGKVGRREGNANAVG